MVFFFSLASRQWRLIIIACVFTSLPFSVHAEDADWAQWLQYQIQQHPEVVAAREHMNAELSGADALDKPLFNPELETEFEREGDADNYRVGINQSIDIWNQRGARRDQARFDRVSAKQRYQLTLEQKLWEALQLLIDYQSATDAAVIAQLQETQIETLITLVEDRQRAGDLGQADATLTYLSLSQQLTDAARAQVRLKRITARLRELLPDLTNVQALIPDTVWKVSTSANPEPWLDTHPIVAAAKANWQSLQQAAAATQRGTKAVPTVGINGGKAGEENVIALSLSMPLHLRNNFSAEARAALQLALAAEAEYHAIRREQRVLLESSYAELEQFQRSYERWQSIVADRINSSATILEQQWQAGDLSTAEYLLALQQRAEGLLAGIELGGETRRAIVDWLLQTGQLQQVLNGL